MVLYTSAQVLPLFIVDYSERNDAPAPPRRPPVRRLLLSLVFIFCNARVGRKESVLTVARRQPEHPQFFSAGEVEEEVVNFYLIQ
jgi:hypothetical protein